MLESIKHTIVLLQIAKVTTFIIFIIPFLKMSICILKNTTHPINGVQVAAPSSVFQSSSPDNFKVSKQQPVKNLTEEVVSVISMEEVPVQTGIEFGAECVERRGATSECTDSVRPPPNINLEQTGFYGQRPPALTMEFPETSYSSSEDEDFYDASENMGQSPTLPT